LSDGDIEKLSKVKGGVYIFNHNSGSVNVKIETTERKLAEALCELVENQGCGFIEIVNIVKRALIEYAWLKTGKITSAARHLGLDGRAFDNHVRLNKNKVLEMKSDLKNVRSLPMEVE
jgi:hypothetical protein